RHRDGHASGEHADLLRVGHRVEIARDDRRHDPPLALRHEARQRPHLLLANVALVEAPVEMRGEELERAARTVDLRADDVAQLLELDGRRQRTNLVPLDRPARQDGVADGHAVDRVAAGEDVVEPEVRRDDGGLVAAAVLPDLLERDHVRSERHQRAPDRVEPRLPRTAAPPQIPRHDPQPGLDERAELEEGLRRHLWQAPPPLPGAARSRKRRPTSAAHSTVTLFARLRGWSTSRPRATATWYARSW